VDPIDTLMDEHRTIERGLDALEVLAGQLADGADISRERPDALLSFIREYGDDFHHQKEEGLLFPALGRAGMPSNMGPVAVMLHEHDVGRAHVESMAAAVDAGLAGDARGAFITHARGFAQLLRSHIQKEDGILYPMARQRITGPQWEELAAGVKAVVDSKRAEAERLVALLDG